MSKATAKPAHRTPIGGRGTGAPTSRRDLVNRLDGIGRWPCKSEAMRAAGHFRSLQISPRNECILEVCGAIPAERR